MAPLGTCPGARRRPSVPGRLLSALGSTAVLAAAAAALMPRGGAALGAVQHLPLSALLPEVPVWMRNRTLDVAIDFTKVDKHAKLHWNTSLESTSFYWRGKRLNLRYNVGYYHGNIAVVRHGMHLVAAVRKMHFIKHNRSEIEGYPGPGEEVTWWGSKVLLCVMNVSTLAPIRCADYDPRPWQECLWNQGFEGTGIEDPRLIVWPGKGLFMMFGSKPWSVNPSGTGPENTRCEGPLAFQQFMVMIQPYYAGNAAAALVDPWQQGIVRLQYFVPPESLPQAEAGSAAAAEAPLYKEKNWNPFIYKGRMLFSQSLSPHVVIQPLPNGTCTKVYETYSHPFRDLPAAPRGNTQAVLVASAFSGEASNYFLGVMHVERNRSYVNHFYKMQAHPPFRILAMSRAIPVVDGQHVHAKQWTHISFPMSLDLIPETNQVMVGYGSGDQVPRIKYMPWQDVQALFSGDEAASYYTASP